MPLCIFRVLLKKETKKTKKKILEWMQICNCAFLYQLVWLNVGLEWCINNDMLTTVDGVAFKNEIYLHILDETPWCQRLLGGRLVKCQWAFRSELFTGFGFLVDIHSSHSASPNEYRYIQKLLVDSNNNGFFLSCSTHVHVWHQRSSNLLCAWNKL